MSAVTTASEPLLELLERKAKHARQRARELEDQASALRERACESSGSAEFFECLAHMCRDREITREAILSLLRETTLPQVCSTMPPEPV